jgi:replicative DNA helicase
VPASEIAHEAVEEVDRLAGGQRSGIPFGFPELDSVTGGNEPGDLVVIQGLEKSGKSVLMIQTAFYNARRGTPVLIFSSEMSRKQIFLRQALIDTGLSWLKMKQGRLTNEDRKSVV